MYLNWDQGQDDIIKSVPTLEDAKRLSSDIEKVLQMGGFKIKEWIISNKTAYENIDVDITENKEGNVLGMVWDPSADVLKFKINSCFDEIELSHPQVFSRRSALSHISRLYDPLGLLTPFTF